MRGRWRVTTPKPIDSTSRAAKSSSHAAYMALKSAVPGWCPPSRAHVSAYSAGSWTSRWTDPGVQAGAVEPGADALGPRRPAGHLPVAEELGDAARLEVVADRPHEVTDDGIAGAAPVAVLEARHRAGPRRDDERRVAHDEPEPLAGDRVEHRAGPHVPVGLVEGGVEAGVGEGPLGQVGDDHLVGVAPEVERLHAAAGAQVEGARDVRPGRPRRERRRGAADAEHVVLAQRRPRRQLAEVGGDPPVDAVGGIRPQVAARDDAVPLGCDEAERHGPSTPRLGRAAATSATSTGSPSVNSRTRVAQGSTEVAVTRWAGSACSRSSAAAAIGPSRSVTPATVNREVTRSARRAATRSGSTRGVVAVIEVERRASRGGPHDGRHDGPGPGRAGRCPGLVVADRAAVYRRRKTTVPDDGGWEARA